MSRALAAASIAVILSLGTAAQASATTITFDEFAPQNYAQGSLPANLYAADGVTFVGTDDSSTWDGNSAGDPGYWGLEGTNGAAFAGFNGASYGVTLNFASQISGFRLDASRAFGSSNGNSLNVNGYLGGNLVSSGVIGFQAINNWSTIFLTGTLDQVVIQGIGDGFHPFGVDNIQWNAGGGVPEPATWAVMLVGFAGAGAALRRRRLRVAHVGF